MFETCKAIVEWTYIPSFLVLKANGKKQTELSNTGNNGNILRNTINETSLF